MDYAPCAGAHGIEESLGRPPSVALRQPVIFVGGVHGVGKTTVSKAIAGLLPASHVTAGGLIRETATAGATVTVGVGNKAVPNVDSNQLLLLQGLEIHRTRVAADRPILLDGHFALLDGNGQVVAIPIAIFSAIAPTAVAIVEASKHTIRARLLARDGDAPSLETIAALVECERTHAEKVGASLGIPLLKVSGDGDSEQAALHAAARLRSLLGGEA